jgi:catechol 2,3-dioxygenase-like lactoylglutathione lyase family enzyme
MIKSIHTLIYAHDAKAARAFFRDTLKLRFVEAMDPGDGWLIFALPPAELGIHPAEDDERGASGRHSISLMCDDIRATIDALRARGVRFTRPVQDEGWGITTMLVIPGAGEMMLYQPRHRSPLKGRPRAKASARPAKRAKAPAKPSRAAAKSAARPARKAGPKAKSERVSSQR